MRLPWSLAMISTRSDCQTPTHLKFFWFLVFACWERGGEGVSALEKTEGRRAAVTGGDGCAAAALLPLEQ